MSVNLPTPGPDDVWGADLNTAIRNVDDRVATLEDVGLPQDGQDGASAYEVAVQSGYTGTVDEWVASLEGPEGPQGPPGDDGADSTVPGPEGDSAYEVAVAAGFTGTEAEWVDSLEGPQGPQGEPGTDGTDGTLPPTETLAADEQLTQITIAGDGTDTAGWPNRWEWLFKPADTVARLVQWVNERGEQRYMPAEPFTVGWRLFLKPTADDPARSAPGWQVVDNRADRNPIAEVDEDEFRANRRLRTPELRQDRDDTSTIGWISEFVGTLTTSVANIAEHRINDVRSAWVNEWGAGRFTSPYSWGDAANRYIREDWDVITEGNYEELVDRRAGAPAQVIAGRSWTDGTLTRNDVTMADVYATTDGDPASNPDIGKLPPGTIIVEY